MHITTVPTDVRVTYKSYATSQWIEFDVTPAPGMGEQVIMLVMSPERAIQMGRDIYNAARQHVARNVPPLEQIGFPPEAVIQVGGQDAE